MNGYQTLRSPSDPPLPSPGSRGRQPPPLGARHPPHHVLEFVPGVKEFRRHHPPPSSLRRGVRSEVMKDDADAHEGQPLPQPHRGARPTPLPSTGEGGGSSPLSTGPVGGGGIATPPPFPLGDGRRPTPPTAFSQAPGRMGVGGGVRRARIRHTFPRTPSHIHEAEHCGMSLAIASTPPMNESGSGMNTESGSG